MDKRDPGYYNCACPVCGKEFHLKPYSLNRNKRHCCSLKCSAIARKEWMAGKNNHQYGLRGNKNASWKSDERTSHYGYILIRCPDHPFRDKADFVFEHRLVAERCLLTDENSVEINGKRYLSPEFVVHHVNFNRKDNRPENLVVMTKAEHQRLHTKLNPPKRDVCGRFEHADGLKIKKVTQTAIIPQKKSEGAAGYDLCADIDEPVVIPPHETVILYSGLAFEIPKGYYGNIYARSGISTKRYLRPSTCVSVIDSDYRGNVGLPVHNDSNVEQVIYPHERVAQLVICKAEYFELEEVDSLPETDRGTGGFGSTGR